jgi:hypothetical protein
MKAQEEDEEEAPPAAEAPGASLAHTAFAAPEAFAFEFPAPFGGMAPFEGQGAPAMVFTPYSDIDVDISHLYEM